MIPSAEAGGRSRTRRNHGGQGNGPVGAESLSRSTLSPPRFLRLMMDPNFFSGFFFYGNTTNLKHSDLFALSSARHLPLPRANPVILADFSPTNETAKANTAFQRPPQHHLKIPRCPESKTCPARRQHKVACPPAVSLALLALMQLSNYTYIHPAHSFLAQSHRFHQFSIKILAT
jgi:hypothetical protein